eukprot:jgi/Chlat1/6972/Chrsp52S06621
MAAAAAVVLPARSVPGPSSSLSSRTAIHGRTSLLPSGTRLRASRPVRGGAVALFGGGGNSGGEGGEAPKKKGLKREEEPDQFWRSEGEASGKNPLADPLALVGILSIFAPFIILGVCFQAGLVRLP